MQHERRRPRAARQRTGATHHRAARRAASPAGVPQPVEAEISPGCRIVRPEACRAARGAWRRNGGRPISRSGGIACCFSCGRTAPLRHPGAVAGSARSLAAPNAAAGRAAKTAGTDRPCATGAYRHIHCATSRDPSLYVGLARRADDLAVRDGHPVADTGRAVSPARGDHHAPGTVIGGLGMSGSGDAGAGKRERGGQKTGMKRSGHGSAEHLGPAGSVQVASLGLSLSDNLRATHLTPKAAYAGDAVQRCMCRSISSRPGIRVLLRSVMIYSEPATTRNTISTPNASASTLLVLSGPVVMWRKKTRCTPIWAMASTARPSGMPGGQINEVFATQKDVPVRITASASPSV